MIHELYKPSFWRYFKGNFLYRVNRRYTKVLPMLKQRIVDMFNYEG